MFAGRRNDLLWNTKYQELADFHKKHGHLRVEYRSSLYTWMITQRKRRKGAKRHVTLTDEQIQLLDEIKFDWNPKPGTQGLNHKGWNTRYQELADFHKKHGHLRVETKSSLNTWMVNQRVRRRGSEVHGPLTDKQIQLLDEIGFAWNPERYQHREADNQIWNSNYQELAEFYKKHGHLRVGIKSSLYMWMLTQRRRRKGAVGRASSLTDEQIQLLDGIDFAWNPKTGPPRGRVNNKKWNSTYQELAEFYKKHGHLKVDVQSSLYYWMANQRRRRKGLNGRTPLTNEQIELLDEIGFAWNPGPGRPGGANDKGWNTKYQELAAFYKKHGHLKVDIKGSLRNWMQTQRRRQRGAKGLSPLTDEQIQSLNEIDFAWNPKQS